MVLTPRQEQGLKIAVDRYRHHEPYTCIAGFAGTGKSTLIRFIVAALNISPDDVCYIAYTGKASLVLKDKGCKNAMTAHKLLYKSRPKGDGTYYHEIKRPIDPYKLIVVDEVSMLPKNMWDLLLSHHVPVIALGDPFQLPALGESNGVLERPHIFLTEIMRQAEENEIIRLTMAMREFKPLELYKGTNIQILDKKDVIDGMYSWADQVIVAKNDTRKQTNYKIRKMLYNIDTPLPIEGDKIVCLRNDWDHPSGAGEIMVNGSLGYIQNIDIQNSKYTNKIILADFIPEEYTDEELQFVPQDVIFRNIKMDYKLFNEGEPTVNKDNWKKIPPPFKPLEFDYGYCITCWKAQGSEYNKVLAFEESFPFKKEDHYKYLYTAATRAKEKLVLIRNN